MAAVLVVGAAVSVLVAVAPETAHATGSPGSTATSTAPPLTVLTPAPQDDHDDIFITPTNTTNPPSTVNGPEIVTTTGKVVWFHPLPAGAFATDFRPQTYHGQPVLTWFQAGDPDGPRGIIFNDRFQPIGSVRAGNGFTMDEHEFLITPWNTALILADGFTTANLTSIGGPANQEVDVEVVQEIDIKTGQVLFQWNPADVVPYSDSQLPLPPSASDAWDWFHINAVHLDTDGNLLVSARNTWAVYKVNRDTGELMWELGGKHSSFTMAASPGQVLDSAGEIFTWQHDPEGFGHGLYTVFDDESAGELPSARVVTVHLNLQTHVATLVDSINQPEGMDSGYAGNAQTTADGNLFVGWGALPFVSEFSLSGQLLFNAELPSGVFSYRAYLLPWASAPAANPPREQGKGKRPPSQHHAGQTHVTGTRRSQPPADPEVPVTG